MQGAPRHKMVAVALYEAILPHVSSSFANTCSQNLIFLFIHDSEFFRNSVNSTDHLKPDLLKVRFGILPYVVLNVRQIICFELRPGTRHAFRIRTRAAFTSPQMFLLIKAFHNQEKYGGQPSMYFQCHVKTITLPFKIQTINAHSRGDFPLTSVPCCVCVWLYCYCSSGSVRVCDQFITESDIDKKNTLMQRCSLFQRERNHKPGFH